jgi:hypothetical protein
MTGIVQRIFREHYPRYRQTHRLSWRERWAAYNIQTCRTAAQGAHVDECPQGHYKVIHYNSCRHRSCPLCGADEIEAWVHAQEQRALSCRYHQVVFTIPDQLHPLWMFNRPEFTHLMFRAAWRSLHSFFTDSRWLGGLPGAIAVFQSWGETLNVHPHLHFLVTAGGLSAGGRWVEPTRDFLFPAAALRAKFQGKFLAYLKQAIQAGTLCAPAPQSAQQALNLFNQLGRRKWNVRIQPAYEHPRGLIKYLAFYLRRGPLSEQRIRHYQAGTVRIAYKRPDQHRQQTLSLTAPEFIRRLLVHVPSKGLRVVRSYGLFHHRCVQQLHSARDQLPSCREALRSEPVPLASTPFIPGPRRCPKCGRALICTLIIHPGPSPPQRLAA